MVLSIEDINKLSKEITKSLTTSSKETKVWNDVTERLSKNYAHVEGTTKSVLTRLLGMSAQTKATAEQFKEVHEAIGGVSKVFAEGVMAYGLYEAFEASQKFNRSLKETNSGMMNRNMLVTAGLTAQLATGASIDETAEAMSALVSLGVKDAETLKSNTVVALELHGALGLSVSTAAQLAAQAKALGVNFRDVGDVIAVVAQNTALSAQEAATYNMNISRALIAFQGKKGGSFFKDITLEVDAFEGKMKEMTGGVSGGISKLIEAVASGEGAINRLYGIGSLGGVEDIGKIMDTLAVQVGQAKTMFADSPEVMNMVLKSISDIYTGGKISVQELAQLTPEYVASSKELYKSLEANNALTKAYAEQSAQAGQVWEQVKNTVVALTEVGLQPLVSLLNGALGYINTFVQTARDWIGYAPGVLTAIGLIGVAISVSVLVVVSKLAGDLVKALFAVGKAITNISDKIVEDARRVSAESSRKSKAIASIDKLNASLPKGSKSVVGGTVASLAAEKTEELAMKALSGVNLGGATTAVTAVAQAVIPSLVGSVFSKISWSSITGMLTTRAGLMQIAKFGGAGAAVAATAAIGYAAGRGLAYGLGYLASRITGGANVGLMASDKEVKAMFDARAKTVDSQVKLLHKYATNTRISTEKYNKAFDTYMNEAKVEGMKMRSGWEETKDVFIDMYNVLGGSAQKYSTQYSNVAIKNLLDQKASDFKGTAEYANDFMRKVNESTLSYEQKHGLYQMAISEARQTQTFSAQSIAASGGVNTEAGKKLVEAQARANIAMEKLISGQERQTQIHMDNPANVAAENAKKKKAMDDARAHEAKTAQGNTPVADGIGAM